MIIDSPTSISNYKYGTFHRTLYKTNSKIFSRYGNTTRLAPLLVNSALFQIDWKRQNDSQNIPFEYVVNIIIQMLLSSWFIRIFKSWIMMTPRITLLGYSHWQRAQHPTYIFMRTVSKSQYQLNRIENSFVIIYQRGLKQ